MAPLVPARFLFRFSIPVKRLEGIPRVSGKTLLDLSPDSTLPDFSEFDQKTPFGQIRLGWNSRGLGISVLVAGKQKPLHVRPDNPWESDSCHFWIDTRNTQSIHRASRFCHHFVGFPQVDGKQKLPAPVRQLAIARAREEYPLGDPKLLQAQCNIQAGGYLLEMWLPAEALHGFDPESNPRLGFYYYLRDQELGEQFLSVNQEFPFATDPSLWWTLELGS